MPMSHQQLPSTGPLREVLRAKGQFWTPPWIADAMVGYLLREGASTIFDPAIGAGAFFLAAKRVGKEIGVSPVMRGTEVDPEALEKAGANGLNSADLARVQIRDFILNPPDGPLEAVVANPPYIRHHRLSAGMKAHLRALGHTALGKPLDGRAGLHVYFLVQALRLLADGGRLAFIMPADTVEGVFARPLWEWISGRFALEAVVTFAPEASPFPGVDTNAIIVMIQNAVPRAEFLWARCERAETDALKKWTLSRLSSTSVDGLAVYKRDLGEALATGLSRPPRQMHDEGPTLGEFASVLRGIATGANDFFHLTGSKANALGIPDDLLVPAIGRTRDVMGEELTQESIDCLDEKGRPTWLFSPDGRPIALFPHAVQTYLREGEELGIPKKPLISTRRPWYRMERRVVPPILFAYLGRRNARFIRNRAGVVPLTCLLCVYPREQDPEHVEKVWEVLHHPETIANLALVGKSYGGGAIKVEPRALETLPLPAHVVEAVGLRKVRPRQLPLCISHHDPVRIDVA